MFVEHHAIKNSQHDFNIMSLIQWQCTDTLEDSYVVNGNNSMSYSPCRRTQTLQNWSSYIQNQIM